MHMGRFSKLLGVIKLLPRLGLVNIGRVLRHRVLLKLEIHPVCRLQAEIPTAPFFQEPANSCSLPASQAWQTRLKYFDWFEPPAGNGPPNWFARPFSGGMDWPSQGPWWKPAAASPGDIKEVWDLSRFNWTLALAQRAAQGDQSELVRLNDWLRDWSAKNPPYSGPNWVCGQEASIRVMHLAVTAVILGQDKCPSQTVQAFVRAHLARIAPTLGYALAQDNNHGVLEAAGLFVGGAWLHAVSGDAQAREWAVLGRKWLEERARRLIAPDGGFSMYSVAYHREFLDALSLSEYWRRRLDLPAFSDLFVERAKAAALWLRAFTHPLSGDVPNIGGNDGTRFMPLSDTDYRDFRPSVQLACVMFARARAYAGDGSWDLPLKWLGVELPEMVLSEGSSRLFDDCGFALLKHADQGSDVQAIVRYPRFRFRPSHADGLHLDFWLNGQNVLRDGGSFSYDVRLGFTDYFMGAQAHNTVQFDQREQMPRLGSFLFGEWPATAQLQYAPDGSALDVSYVDYMGASHLRKVRLGSGCLEVQDVVAGFRDGALLRWRLGPGNWVLGEGMISDGKHTLAFSADVPVHRVELKTGWESRYYRQKNEMPVLEIEIRQPGTLITQFGWTQ